MKGNAGDIDVKVSVSNRDKKFYPNPTKLPDFLRPLFQIEYITKEGLENLKLYRYHGSDWSWISNNIGQPFWKACVLLLPTYMAPNLVTLVGFFAIILNYLLLVYYCPTFECSHLPPWFYILSALFMFFYQTMDAIDGKQARRTNSSSALGELFDHGCDACTIGLAYITMCYSLNSGGYSVSATTEAVVCMAFFCAQWEEYYTGEMVLGEMGVTELELVIIFLYLTLFSLGPGWTHYVFLGFTLGNWVLILSGLSCIKTVLVENIPRVRKHLEKSENRNKLSLAFKSLIPSLAVNAALLLCTFLSPAGIFNTHYMHFVSLSFTFYNAGLTCRQVLAKVCSMGDMFQVFLFPFPIVLCLINCLLIRSVALDHFLIVFSGIWAVLCYLHFAFSVIEKICQKIGINCLRIGHNDEYKSYFHYLQDYFNGKIKE